MILIHGERGEHATELGRRAVADKIEILCRTSTGQHLIGTRATHRVARLESAGLLHRYSQGCDDLESVTVAEASRWCDAAGVRFGVTPGQRQPGRAGLGIARPHLVTPG